MHETEGYKPTPRFRLSWGSQFILTLITLLSVFGILMGVYYSITWVMGNYPTYGLYISIGVSIILLAATVTTIMRIEP